MDIALKKKIEEREWKKKDVPTNTGSVLGPL
jgi:hypothetical protein